MITASPISAPVQRTCVSRSEEMPDSRIDLRDRAVRARRASRRRTPSRSRPQADAAATRSRRESDRRRAHREVRLSAYTSSERGVAQPGQSAAFGTQKPPVRIRPPRLWVSQTLIVAAALAPGFHASVQPIPPQMRAQMTGVSWHAGCPVGLGRAPPDHAHLPRLRRSRPHRAPDREPQRGRPARHRLPPPLRRPLPDPADGARRPLRRRRLPLDRGRQHLGVQLPRATGSSHWSNHAYGLAIDVNPIENPYISSGRSSHPASAPYLDRSRHRPGMAYAGGVLVEAFRVGRLGLGRELVGLRPGHAALLLERAIGLPPCCAEP